MKESKGNRDDFKRREASVKKIINKKETKTSPKLKKFH